MTIWAHGVARQLSKHPETRQNWQSTMAQAVEWSTSDAWVKDAPGIEDLHPTRSTYFWGYHSPLVTEMKTGDIVLFFGDGHVHHIGRVGLSFVSPRFRERYWASITDDKPFDYVYSLTGLIDLQDEFPTASMWRQAGKESPRYPQGLGRIQEFADGVANVFAHQIELLDLDYEAEYRAGERHDEDLLKDIRRNRQEGTSYTREATQVIVKYLEDSLVKRYESFLTSQGGGQSIHRGTRSNTAGQIDAFRTSPAGLRSLVEAKARADASRVRMAIGQLLDYTQGAPSDEFPSALEVLVPERPAEHHVTLCRRLGIDLTFEENEGSFRTLAGNSEARERLLESLRPSN